MEQGKLKQNQPKYQTRPEGFVYLPICLSHSSKLNWTRYTQVCSNLFLPLSLCFILLLLSLSSSYPFTLSNNFFNFIYSLYTFWFVLFWCHFFFLSKGVPLKFYKVRFFVLFTNLAPFPFFSCFFLFVNINH